MPSGGSPRLSTFHETLRSRSAGGVTAAWAPPPYLQSPVGGQIKRGEKRLTEGICCLQSATQCTMSGQRAAHHAHSSARTVTADRIPPSGGSRTEAGAAVVARAARRWSNQGCNTFSISSALLGRERRESREAAANGSDRTNLVRSCQPSGCTPGLTPTRPQSSAADAKIVRSLRLNAGAA